MSLSDWTGLMSLVGLATLVIGLDAYFNHYLTHFDGPGQIQIAFDFPCTALVASFA